MKPRPPLFRGFTLIEVLVSLAIFALAAVALAGAYVNTLTAFDAVARRNGHEQDLKLLRAAVLTESGRKEMEKGGELTLPDDRRGRWEAKIEPTTVADLFRVTLHCEVSGATAGAAWTKDFELMLLRPTWSESDAREKLRGISRTKLAERKTP